jgi:hypothetical protein
MGNAPGSPAQLSDLCLKGKFRLRGPVGGWAGATRAHAGGCRRVGVVLERLDEPLENRSQGRWNGPAVDGGQQVPVPLNPWVIGDLQPEQQLGAVVGVSALPKVWA